MFGRFPEDGMGVLSAPTSVDLAPREHHLQSQFVREGPVDRCSTVRPCVGMVVERRPPEAPALPTADRRPARRVVPDVIDGGTHGVRH